MLKKIITSICFCFLTLLFCGSALDLDVNNNANSGSVDIVKILTKRKKVKIREYRQYVSDPNMDDNTIRYLMKLYKLPSKNKYIFSVAGSFDFTNNPFYTNTEDGYKPFLLKDMPALKSQFSEITGREPLLNGIELTYALDEYWSLFNNKTVPSGPEINDKYYAYLVSIVKKAYNDYGSVPVITYHMANPYSPVPPGRYGAYQEYKDIDHKNVVEEMRLNSGDRCGHKGEFNKPRDYLDNKLDRLAVFISELKDKRGKPIPCIIRLFHEMDMNSFWWGKDYCSAEDYKWLYKYSVERISSALKSHNLIWGYSLGSRFSDSTTMMERYPGDEYVDVIGGDEYNIGSSLAKTENTVNRSVLITKECLLRNKICCLFECGISNISGSDSLMNEYYYNYYLPNLLNRNDVAFSFVLGYDGRYSFPTNQVGKENMRRFVKNKSVYR